jgi:hypothetical protein
MNLDYFVVSLAEYKKLHTELCEIFQPDQSLPALVFEQGFDEFRFIEFDRMLSPAFWSTLEASATLFGDDLILMGLRKPDPIEYYYAHFGRCGIIKLRPGETADTYSECLFDVPNSSPADALQHITSIGCWWGNTQDWGIWGERDVGIGILAHRSSRDIGLLPSTIPVLEDAHEALHAFVSNNFRNESAYEEFRSIFLTNYRTVRRLRR